MNFRVRSGSDDLPVKFEFATQKDLMRLSRWRSPKNLRDNAHIQDAIEYCRLAGKRWRSYRAARRTASSLRDVGRAIKENPRIEIVFVMVARASWHEPSPILGFCFCRRTWCHHLVVDFAAAHPNAIGLANGKVHGVGTGMLYSLAKIAADLGIKTIWGEATENSAKFYMKALGLSNVTDHFFIRGRTRVHCLQKFDLVAWHDPA